MATLKGSSVRLAGLSLSTQANIRAGEFSRTRDLIPTSGSVKVSPITDPTPKHPAKADFTTARSQLSGVRQSRAYSDDNHRNTQAATNPAKESRHVVE